MSDAKKVPNIFPITLNAYDTGHIVIMDDFVRKVWMRVRPRNISWYAVNGTVKEDGLHIDVKDMRSLAYGGIGDTINTMLVTEFTSEEQEMLQNLIAEKQRHIAEEEYKKRQQVAKMLAIERIRIELFGE